MKNKLLFNNTYKKGTVTALIYKHKSDKYFTGVALEFGLVIKAKTLNAARECLFDVVDNYLKNVQENKLSEELLNRPADIEYWKVYKQALEESKKLVELSVNHKPVINKLKVPFNLSFQGYQNGNLSYL